MTLELVVARYREDLGWLRNIPPQVRATVYDKNPDAPHPGARLLPNIGREAHTYLHHIWTCYDDLAPLSLFCQGKPFDHAFDFHATLRRLSVHPESVRDFEALGHIIDTDDARGLRLFVGWSKNEDGRMLDVSGFYRALWEEAAPHEFIFRPGAHFVVTRDVIRSQGRDFYARALELSTTFPDAGHCFERLWPRVFGVSNPDEVLLDGQQTMYLKPVRRLRE